MRTASPIFAAVLAAVVATSAPAQEAKKLSDPTVPTATTVGTDDLFYIMQSGAGKKISGLNLHAGIFALGLPNDIVSHYDQIDASNSPSDQFVLAWDTDAEVFVWQNGASGVPDGNYGALTVTSGSWSLNNGAVYSPEVLNPFDDTYAAGYSIRLGGFGGDTLLWAPHNATDVSWIIASDVEDAGTGTCISRDSGSDTLFHDTDCDDTRDSGEGFLGDTYVITVGASFHNPTDAQTTYAGNPGQAPTTDTNASRRALVPVTGVVTSALWSCFSDGAGAAGSNESWAMNLRHNNTTDHSLGSVASASVPRTWSASLSIAVSAGDFFEIKSTNPTWATNPTSVYCNGSIVVTR